MVALRLLALAKCDRAWVQGNSTRLGGTQKTRCSFCPGSSLSGLESITALLRTWEHWVGWSGAQSSFGNWSFRIMGFFPCHPWLSSQTRLPPLPGGCLRVHPAPHCRHQHSYFFRFFLVLIPVPSGPCFLQKCSAEPIHIEL